MALKPFPRLILIAAVVGGAIFGASKYMSSSAPQAGSQVQQSSQQESAPAAPVKTTTTATNTNTNASAASGDAYQNIIEKGVVRVAVQSPSKPFYWVENGKPAGFNYEFLQIMFSQSEFTTGHNKIRLDTDQSVDTYPEVPEALLKTDSRGKPVVDIAIDGLTFTDDDLAGVNYSIAYVDDFGYSLITAKGLSLRSADDINSMTVGVLKGDPDVKSYVSRQFPKAKVVELSDATTNGQRTWINDFIKAGKVDAIVYDYPFAVAEIKETDLQFAVSKLPGSDIKYKIGVRKGDQKLLENINIAIRKVKTSPSYIDLMKKYFMSANVAKARGAEKHETVYVVKSGDTLSKIAGALLGNSMRYGEIETRNNIPNPNLIAVGQKLVIPK